MKELILLIDRRDARVTLEGGSICVRRPDHKPRFVPLGLLGQLIVSGNPEVETRVWRALGERNIPAVLLPVRGKGQGVWFGNGLGSSIAVRVAQHRAWNGSLGVEIARELVKDKVESYIVLGREREMPETVARMEECIGRLPEARSQVELMGVEGAAASAWWEGLARAMDERWEFRGRNRRPPRDPVNALLSLGYTLLASEVTGAIHATGLDPALGFLHGVVPGRDSLVLDLMEPLRAGVDAWVLSLIEKGEITPRQFTRSEADGCRLSSEGRRSFYEAWAEVRAEWWEPGEPPAPLETLCRGRARWLRQKLGPYDPQTGEMPDG